MIRFSCPNCHATFEVEDELAGARVECFGCKFHFVAPLESESASPAEEFTSLSDESASALEKPVPFAEKPTAPVNSPDSVPAKQGEFDLSTGFSECSEAKPTASAPASASDPLREPSSGGATPTAPSPVRSKLSPRQRRLASDFRMMQDRFTNFLLIHLERTQGNPPENYVISYRVRGVERLRGKEVVFRDYHEVEIKLPGTYPRTPPTCRMLTPVFHPNIEPAIICIGDHWTASERLCDLVVRIGEMIAYQAHNIKSPLDGEAAMWCDLHQDMLPVDNRDLTPPEP